MDSSNHNGIMTALSEEMERSLSMDTDDRMDAYHRYISGGKDAARQGDLMKALEFFRLAYDILPSRKLERRVKKIEELMAQNDSESDDDEFVDVNNSGLMLFKELHDKLYNYQRDGVAFLYGLYREGRKGGILADDMGLGKTIQVISFLSGMYDAELVKHTLLIMPASLITTWSKEFAKWTPGMRVKEFHGSSKAERSRNLDQIQRKSGIVITTYQMLMNNWQQLSSYQGREFRWDYMILDEAHKIKTTSTKTAKSATAVPAKNRILLTGTPVQNNLREMWALFDFACQSTLLGTAKTFKAEYENPITRARERDATPGEKALGFSMSENLMAIIKPYFLRRTKAEVQSDKMNRASACEEEHLERKDGQVSVHKTHPGAEMPHLTRKNDLIVWTYLSRIQEEIYRQFISLDHIKELLSTTRSPLAELTILKKLCDHPRMLSGAAFAKLGLEENVSESQQDDGDGDTVHGIGNIPDETLISESGKLTFLFELLERLRQEGHRTLVFSHFRKVLDIIEQILINRGFRVMRLDGRITQLAERERRISRFQTDKRYSVFLLTTQVGGVGITLTGANRVVIYDPSWNPATDAQAVDRAYRIGQTENVVIYRLITCGTVEEKIYRRQIFKDSLIRQNTGDKKNPFRYFSKQELKELFMLEDTRSSSTQLQLQTMHSRHRKTDPQLDEHIAHLHTMDMFGISDHDLMFSLDVDHDEVPEDKESHHYIEGRVQKAQELMKAESELQMQLAESVASSTEPAWLRLPVQNGKERSQKKKFRNPRASPTSALQDGDLNGSAVLLESDQSGSGKEDSNQNLRKQVIDLTVDESMTEDQNNQDEDRELILDSPIHLAFTPERSDLEAAEAAVQDVAEESVVMSGAADAEESVVMSEAADAEESVVMSEAADAKEAAVQKVMQESSGTSESLSELQPNKNSHSTWDDSQNEETSLDVERPRVSLLQNKRLSAVLWESNSSIRAQTSPGNGSELESFHGNFNLQLEDSDVFSDQDLDENQTEAEERKLLSKLQMEGSFNVDKSLSERKDGEGTQHNISSLHSSEQEQSDDDSLIVTQKKRAAVIYDSEEEDDDGQRLMKSQLEDSIQALGASTPKTASLSTPLGSRRSVGGNTSVASRRSFIHSISEDEEGDEELVPDSEEEEEEEEAAVDEEEEEEDEAAVEEEEDEEDEAVVEEEEEEKYYEESSRQEVSDELEESTGEAELSSTERMELCTVGPAATPTQYCERQAGADQAAGSYSSLVCRGRQCYSEGKLEEALSFFLQAIDIKSGDPEIQLLTIQLYRRLSQLIPSKV